MSFQEIGLLLWGLGLFLFGTFLFEGAITNLVNRTFKNILKRATNTPFKAILSGTFTTAILQSSAVVSLIVVSFVGAWILDLSNGIAVILGVNIWGPLTDILLGNLGLKFSLSTIAFPILGFSALMSLIFSQHKKFVSICNAFFALGLIFLGLGFMKESMVTLANNFDFLAYSSYPMIMFFWIGMFLTVLMQSSSATTVLVLTAASAGMLDYRMWVPLLMGAFLATTLTVVLGSLHGDAIKKQVAFSHVFFNLFAVIVGFIFIVPILSILNYFFHSDIILGLSIFAISFKIIATLLLLPFFSPFISLLKHLFVQKPSTFGLYIETTSPTVLDAALVALEHDSKKLLKKVFVYVMNSWWVDVDTMLDWKNTLSSKAIAKTQISLSWHKLAEQYHEIKHIEEDLVSFISKSRLIVTNQEEGVLFSQYYQAISSMVYAAKYIKDISQNMEHFCDEENSWTWKTYKELRILLIHLYKRASKIIDGVHDASLVDQMIDSVKQMKHDDQNFVHALSKQITKEHIGDLELSDVLHLHHYVYLSSVSFVEAVNLLLLKSNIDSD